METVSKENFEKEVLKSELPVLVKFTADYCGPCKRIQPILDKIAEELEGKAKLVKLDTDNDPEISSEYKIKSIPSFIVFKDGKILNRGSGSQTPKEDIIAMFELNDK
jgi:thioredoxin 1